MKKFLAGFLVVCVLAAAFVAGHVVYRDAPVLLADTKKDDRVVVMDGKTGEVSVVNDTKMRALMESMDRKAEEARRNAPSPEEARKKFLEVWGGIKSHMVDPEPGTYPVRFYGPVEEDGVYLMSELGDSRAFWIDNRHVIYWGGVLPDPPPKFGWYSRYGLAVLDVDTGKTVREIARVDGPYSGWHCLDEKTKSYSYGFPDKGYEPTDRNGQKLRVDHLGYLDSGMNFHESNQLEKPLCGHWSARFKGGKVRPEKSEGKAKCVVTHPDGRRTEIEIDLRGRCDFISYDPIRDQYYSALHYSEEDQRSSIRYFDRDFKFVEEVVMPRVRLEGGYPESFLSGGISRPVKDGFVIGCGRRGDDEAKIDFDGEPVRKYLCHVKRDQTIVRAVVGDVNGLAVSPDGCRVFGFWKERSNTNKLYGKNFMVDLCVETTGKTGE